jgi:lipoprotein-anchoring transpeptidase ErfK/SrfK
MFKTIRKLCSVGIVVLLIAIVLAADPSFSATSYASPHRPSVGNISSVSNGQGKIIVVSLSQQELDAYDNGQLLGSTPVATGRPDLPTPTGTYHIFAKYSPYTFVSPWPVGSPDYYQPSTVHYAMEWAQGGYFIHDAPWRKYFGKGANNWHWDPLMGEDPGTHGCINVPTSVMSDLFSWATIGTTVQINP